MNGLTVLPAVELLSMLRRGQISPLELADEYIQQIERLNPQLHALVDFDAERVRAQARALENVQRAARPSVRVADDDQVVDRDRRIPLRNRQPAAPGTYPQENATVVDRVLAGRRADSGNHQLP